MKIRLPLALTVILAGAACTAPGAPSRPTPTGARPRPSTPPPSTAPLPAGLSGLIAYSEGGDIWVMDADGSNRRRVTHAGGHDFDPSLSPDGTRVVFRTSRGHFEPDLVGSGAEGILVVGVDGRNEHEIQPPQGGLFPDWSPDGKRIAFGSQRFGTFDVFVMNADGTHLVRLTRGPNGESPAAWLPDGRIVVASFRGDAPVPDWYVMDADGSDVQHLPQLQGVPDPMDWLASPR
jgi:Tol biopolymer transport system component